MKHKILFVLCIFFLLSSCENSDFGENALDFASQSIEFKDGRIVAPIWLSDIISKIEDGQEDALPWVMKIDFGDQEYLSIYIPQSGERYFYTNNGVEIADSYLVDILKQGRNDFVWRSKKKSATTRSSVVTPASIYTPYGSLVPDSYFINEVYPNSVENQALSDNTQYQYPNAEVLGPSTNSYNCHGYAWAMNGSTYNPVWVGLFSEFSEDIYWEDYSYVESTEASGRIVSYRFSDHSAIATSTHDVFVSKWGDGPLMRHNRYYSPYSASSVKFYKRNPKPTYYIGRDIDDYSSSSMSLSLSSGYAGTTLHAYTATRNQITRYQWSAEFQGECDSWYYWPSSNNIDVSIYSSGISEGGMLRVTCSMYNGSILLATTSYYINVTP